MACGCAIIKILIIIAAGLGRENPRRTKCGICIKAAAKEHYRLWMGMM
jgi:hypothetical protein